MMMWRRYGAVVTVVLGLSYFVCSPTRGQPASLAAPEAEPASEAGFVETPADIAAVKQDEPTPEQIAIYIPLGGELAADSARVRFRRKGTTAWQLAHPLYRIRPEWNAGGAPVPPVAALAGTLFDLEPGTTYEIEIDLVGDAPRRFRRVMATRALPPPAGRKTHSVEPTDDLQAAFDKLAAGDVLELANGTYQVEGLQFRASGSARRPIYVRGASREGVVIKNATGIILQIVAASHVIFENLTLEGSGKDSGTKAKSIGVSFWSDGKYSHVTFRQLAIRGVDMGIVGWAPLRAVLVYDNELKGNNPWTRPFIDTNLTWNDDGLRLPGEGNCGFNNTLYGFGDSVAVKNGVFSAAVYFYRNLILASGDDAFEGDFATRNIGFYDNYIRNAATFFSIDPLWGGPLYSFRNIVINTVRGPFKWNDTGSGFLVYNNTILRTKGDREWAFVQFNNGALRGWSYRNNLLHSVGGSDKLMALESAGNDPVDFTHNAWYPDGAIWWTASGGSFSSLLGAKLGLAPTSPLFGDSPRRHDDDVLMRARPFVEPAPLGPDYSTEVKSFYIPTPRDSAAIKHAGVEIPGITDGFTGRAPDIGAVIEGRPQPVWGASW